MPYHASSCNGPVELVLSDVYGYELHMFQIMGEEDGCIGSSISADATLAGIPLSVPWSVQYIFLKQRQIILPLCLYTNTAISCLY